MKEYTILAVVAVVATILLDRWSGVNLLRRKEYYVFLLIIAGFKLLVNGYLTGMAGQAIVLYEPRFFLGLRIITIPVEDFMFGFGMVTLSVIVWERMRGNVRRNSS